MLALSWPRKPRNTPPKIRREPGADLKLRRDPAPTRMSYRYHRLMLTPVFRAAVRIGLPVLLIVFIATAWFTNDANRAMLGAKITAWTEAFQHRPSFMVAGLQVVGADEDLHAAIIKDLRLSFPVSSFDLDLEAIRTSVIAFSAVKDATVGVQTGGVQTGGVQTVGVQTVGVQTGGTLQIGVTQREPVAIWRYQNGLWLIDDEGIATGLLTARADRGDLPLIAGDGAKDVIIEALALFQAAAPIKDRVRGLVRMSERRWDLVLDRDQRILLPHDDPVAALQRVMVLHDAQDMLERDILTVDMRLGPRPTIRLSGPAVAILRNTTATQAEAGQ